MTSLTCARVWIKKLFKELCFVKPDQCCQDCEFIRILAQFSEFGGLVEVTRPTDRSEALCSLVGGRIDKGCQS